MGSTSQDDIDPPLAIVLAAGKGKRMGGDRPKVLCEARGRPLIDYVLDALAAAGIEKTLVVVGHGADEVRRRLAGRRGLAFVEQTVQHGTGHAVQVCEPLLREHDGAVVVVTGDSPMLQPRSLEILLGEFQSARPACILGTLHKDDPTGLGRIVRDDRGDFQAIVEQADATDQQRAVTEVNMSTYVFDCRPLLGALAQLAADNRQQELYLTDCPGILKAAGRDVRALPVLAPCEALSVNTPDELAQVEAEMERMGY